MNYQAGILAPVPAAARYLCFQLKHQANVRPPLHQLLALADGHNLVVGLGKSLLLLLGIKKPALPNFPSYTHAGINIPSTPADIWCWLRGNERGDLLLQSQHLIATLSPAFECVHIVDAFNHQGGRDLSGYEDGTENPTDKEALRTAIVDGEGQGLDGGSFVAVQQWQHDMTVLRQFTREEQDYMIGRRHSDNEELEDAPESAHVKRTAQESFSPEAFILRRSMSWSAGADRGLMFAAFGHSLQAFSVQLRRMAGLEDGITDALFRFTKPLTGAYFWCPPMRDGCLDVRWPN